jgi:hypothetical protein
MPRLIPVITRLGIRPWKLLPLAPCGPTHDSVHASYLAWAVPNRGTASMKGRRTDRAASQSRTAPSTQRAELGCRGLVQPSCNYNSNDWRVSETLGSFPLTLIGVIRLRRPRL